MNFLLCSVGRRGEIMKNIRQSLSSGSMLVATDNSRFAPALYLADKQYLVPLIKDPEYIPSLLEICRREHIQAVTTFIDPEIEILARNRDRFAEIGVEVLAPYEQTAHLCFDKYEMYKYLSTKGIPTIKTWGDAASFTKDFRSGDVSFPVFVKPRSGSGSVGAHKVETLKELEIAFNEDPTIIVQEYMDCLDLDADVYVDTISHKAVTAFSKKKLETRISGASKTVSFIDHSLYSFIQEIVDGLRFNGPIDMDFFYSDGTYYLSEINPRFGGAYLHAYGAGVDFIKLIENNVNGIENKPDFGNYEEGVVMMMYDSVVIRREADLAATRLGTGE